ncbi:Uma2 family endonuclease [Acrocarpospora sp. B8E8]|uniref:Uma2 family endonuclease n=1 Tax=Acrocarpospora sp. B8E8 TaxID=3153572 RepID=UPI00325F4B1E
MTESETPDTGRVTVMATKEPWTEPTLELTVHPSKPPFTVDDLLQFPEDGNRYELLNGSLLVSPSPVPMHQRVVSRLQAIFEAVAPPEFDTLADVNLRIGPSDFFIPDLAVVRADDVELTPLMFAPKEILLVIEIGSRATQLRDRVLKRASYAEAGIPIYWRVEIIETPVVFTYELDGEEYRPAERFEAGSVATLPAPFEISFDPAQLIARRGGPVNPEVR